MSTKKKLLQAAAGSASGGAGGLNVEQVFSTYLYDGNGSSQVIENGINLGQSNGSGSVELSSNYIDISSSISLSGDFTLEAWVWLDKSSYAVIIGNSSLSPNVQFGINSSQQVYITDPTELVSSGTINLREWTHVAVSRSGSTVYYFINGTASGTQTSSATLTYQQIGTVANVYNMWEGYISDLRIVSGSALYTSSFTAPTAPLTAVTGTQLLACQGDSPLTDNSSNGYTLTAQDNAKASTFGPFDAADAGEGGMVWVKSRTNAANHSLTDTARGGDKTIYTSGTFAEGNPTVMSFNSNGWSWVSGNFANTNVSGQSYASWTFRKAPKFFTCLTYTGTGPASGANEQQVSHDLGVKPAVVIIKRTDSTGDWWFFTDVIDGSNDYGYLNQTAAFGNSSNNVPTDSVFNVGGTLNVSGATYVAYLFAHNDGDGDFGPTGDQDIIKCGSYSGNGSASGPSINLGFEPQWLLVKRADDVADWLVWDAMRGAGSNNTVKLQVNTSNTEDTLGEPIGFNATGFQPLGADSEINNGSGTYIYIAIRRGPMAVPTAATEVFDAHVATTSSETVNVGFPTDFSIFKGKDFVQEWYATPRLTGGYMQTNATAQEGANPYIEFDAQNQLPTSLSGNYLHLNWKRAPNYFDTVAYTGNSTAGRTVSHNLGVAPEMMWIKSRSNSDGWYVYHKDTGATKYLTLNSSSAATTDTWINNTAPTDSVFTLGGSGSGVNYSGLNYIAYLFASLDGVSKVGSYTGTGSSIQNIDCGFTAGSAFVMIKRTDTTGDWIVYDVERGITVNTSDGVLRLNTTNAEATENTLFGGNRMIPRTYGFAVVESDLNASGGSYIFYAISA